MPSNICDVGRLEGAKVGTSTSTSYPSTRSVTAVVFASKAAKGDGKIVLARGGLTSGIRTIGVSTRPKATVLDMLPVRRTFYLIVS